MRNGKKKSRGDIYISWEYPLLSITFRVLRSGWWHKRLLQRRWYNLLETLLPQCSKIVLMKNFILAQGLAKLRFACMTAGPNGSLSCNLSFCAPVTIDVSACPSSIFIRVAAAAEKHDFASRSPRSCWHCAQWHSRGCARAACIRGFVVQLGSRNV